MARFPQGRINSLERDAEGFAELFPAIAGRLANVHGGGRLGRLRRALFALTASILEKVAEFDMDAYRALAEVVAPSSTRPLPVATIVQFSATQGPAQRVPAGAEVRTVGAPDVNTFYHDRSCRFRVTADVDVGPFAIRNAHALGGALGFELVATSTRPLEDVIGDDLRIYVDGPREGALLVLTHLLAHTARIELSTAQAGTCLLRRVRPYGTSVDDVLAPEIDGPPNASALVREYFVFPEKFSFFVVEGVARALRGTKAVVATIVLRFREPLPPGTSIGADSLLPHCAPVINLFPAHSEPQTFGPGQSSFAVHVAGLARGRSSTYDVVSATATPRDRLAPEVALPRAHRFAADSISEAFPYAFSTRRVAVSAPPDRDTSLVVALTSPRGARPLLEPHVVSLRLRATNGACKVAPGEVTEAGAEFPASVAVRNILPGSPYVPPSVGTDLAFRAIMRGAIPPRDALFTLRTLLLSLLPPEDLDPILFRANLGRIHAIEQLAVTPAFDHEGSRRGYLFQFIVDETAFRGVGDVGLFFYVVQQLLHTHVSLNGFCRVEVQCRKTGAFIAWPPATPVTRPEHHHQHPCDAPANARVEVAQPESGAPSVEAPSAPSLEDLAPVICQYDFFEATRMLEHILDIDLSRESYAASPIRFGQQASLTHPATDIERLIIDRKQGGDGARLIMRFLGLVGTSSPLSASWTDAVFDADDEGRLQGFYDVLHHVFALRLYRAWKSRSIEGGFDLEGRDPLSQTLRSLAGVDALTTLPDEPVSDMVILGLADFRRGHAHAIDLRSAERLLQRLLHPLPISLEPNVRRTVQVGPSEVTRLGRNGAILGKTFVYGVERNDTDGMLALHMGPVDKATYQWLMPGGSGYTALWRLLTWLFDDKLLPMLAVRVAPENAPTLRLGAARLNVDTFYADAIDKEVLTLVPLVADPEKAVRQFVTYGDASC
ncbi:type VI secretion system baseplate subunit TssG [Pendulispora brunnea]|uniref:Type VI secretion system baseplate subunit TssG n=1 Tax=Pendulispora brunnea TaxID=2905690 RepID=A0ABZ2KIP5_9BACT